MKHWRSVMALVAATVVVAVAVTSGTAANALFSPASATAAGSVTTARVFPGLRTTSAWGVRDASAGGAEANLTDATAAVDARLFTSSFLTAAFSSLRYIDVMFNAPLPGNIAVTGAILNLSFAASGGGTTCIYVEVRTASTNAVLGTHGSSSTPLACSSTTTQSASATSVPEVISSTSANDLKVRIFARNSSSKRLTLDQVTVSGTAYSAFSLFGASIADASSSIPITTPWSLGAVDTTASYTSASAWATSFSSARYLTFSFPAYVPTGATITAATLRHTYANSVSGTTCYWLEVYNGPTLLAARGSTTTPVSCNTTTIFATDTISFPEVDTVAEANNLMAKIYVRNSGSDKSRHDAILLDLRYSLT